MSITRAADKLNMTQPAVSIAVKELEAFYSTQLFDRVGRKITLTESGERLLSYVRSILNGFEDSVADIRDASNLKVCRIGVNVTLSESYLSGLTAYLRKKIPSLSLKLFVNNNKELEEHLAQGEIDFALMDSPIRLPGRVIEKLFDEEMCLVCSPKLVEKTSLSMDELATLPLLLRETGSGCRLCIDRKLKKIGKSPNIMAESISSKTLTRLAREGLGVVVMPSAMTEEYANDPALKMLTINDDSFVRHYYLAYLSSKYQTQTVKTAIASVREFFSGPKNA